MDTASNIVHEAETQRQHVRVRVPGTLEVEAGDGRLKLRLQDLSAGGVGFSAAPGTTLRQGQRCAGYLKLAVEGLALAIPVRFHVMHFDSSSGRGGGSFQDLGKAEIATVRRIVTAALSGELVGVDDVLHTLSRNNFTTARKDGGGSGEAKRGPRLGSVMLTLLFVAIGIGALLYAGNEINGRLFGASAVSARVSGPSYAVTMPRDGVFRSLVPADGEVKKGAPIGSYETSMLDLVRDQVLSAKLDQATLDALLQHAVKGTITSPCDCRVHSLLSADGQYVGKGQSLAELVPTTFTPNIVARFRYPQAERVQPGTEVDLDISGELRSRQGRIVQVRPRGNDALSDEVVATIETREPIDPALMSRRVEVSTRDSRLLSRVQMAFGGLLGTADASQGGAQR